MANSVTARFNDDCKVFVSMSDDTTVEKAVIIDAEGNETDIGGGGGSSDFSTAEVSVVIHTEDDFISNLFMVIILEENRMQTAPGLNQGTFTVPLFKGSLYTAYTGLNPAKLTVTGDAEYDSEHGDLTITGNCTITLNSQFDPA